MTGRSITPKKTGRKNAKRRNTRGAVLAMSMMLAMIIAGTVVLANQTKVSGETVLEADTSSFENADGQWDGVTEEADFGNAEESGTVAATYKDGVVYADEVRDIYLARLGENGFGDSGADANSVATAVLREAVTGRVLERQANILGLDVFTEDEENAMQAQAERAFENEKAFYAAALGTDSDAEIEEAMTSAGITVESLIAEARADQIRDRLYAYVASNVDVTDAEVHTAYETMLAEQKVAFAENPQEFAWYANNGGVVTWIPDGYRIVKDIFLPFTDEADEARARILFGEISLLDPATDYEQLMAYNDELREVFSGLDVQADALIAQLADGADFDTLMLEYGKDPNMTGADSGYYVSADTSGLWSDEFVEGAMNLEEVGQYTPISMRSEYGVHIILYAADAIPGEVPLDKIRTQMVSHTRLEKADRVYDAQVEAWLAEADAQYFPETLKQG